MNHRIRYRSLLPIYSLVLFLFFLAGIGGSHAVDVFQNNIPVKRNSQILIDAGHGGVDGGASTPDGKKESDINLEIALRLEDLCHFLGMETVMIRRTDTSIHTNGESISQKKISDLKERVRIANASQFATVISIHQNYFSDSRYSGAQVFYGNGENANDLAVKLQTALRSYLNPGSNRKAKKADGIYIMEKMKGLGVLVECGFLSNPEEAAKLQTKTYQEKICAVIATTVSQFLTEKK